MKNRILTFIGKIGISQREFCEKTDMPPGTITNMTYGPRADKIANIARAYPELNLRWLLLGEGDMFIGKYAHAPVNGDDWYRNQIELKDRQISFLMDMCKSLSGKSVTFNTNL